MAVDEGLVKGNEHLRAPSSKGGDGEGDDHDSEAGREAEARRSHEAGRLADRLHARYLAACGIGWRRPSAVLFRFVWSPLAGLPARPVAMAEAVAQRLYFSFNGVFEWEEGASAEEGVDGCFEDATHPLFSPDSASLVAGWGTALDAAYGHAAHRAWREAARRREGAAQVDDSDPSDAGLPMAVGNKAKKSPVVANFFDKLRTRDRIVRYILGYAFSFILDNCLASNEARPFAPAPRLIRPSLPPSLSRVRPSIVHPSFPRSRTKHSP